MTALAGMTPEQREQCVGMWVDLTPPEWSDEPPGKAVGVLISTTEWEAAVVDPKFGFDRSVDLTTWYISTDHITPRWDLPRAWQADGKPVKMDVETAIEYSNHQPPTRMRRFVGEWEGA